MKIPVPAGASSQTRLQPLSLRSALPQGWRVGRDFLGPLALLLFLLVELWALAWAFSDLWGWAS